MKFLLRLALLCLLSWGSAYAQSNLPPCPSSGYLHNCYGTFTYSNGNRYVGEWKDDRFGGQGTLFLYGRSDTRQGIWSDGVLIQSSLVQPSVVDYPTANIPPTQTITMGNLPACPSSGFFHNCFGAFTYSNKNKYVGEWRNDKFDGKGTLQVFGSNNIKEGIWSEGIFVRQSLIQEVNFSNQSVNFPQQQIPQLTAQEKQRLENEKLREEAAVARQRQRELEEQLRQAQQGSSVPTQTASIGPVGRRVALVVGNANYKVRPLKNPRNDADDVSRSLKATGFEVIDLRDATLPQMRTAVRQFGDRLINNDVGLVYYSGHGVEVKGRNYFIPVNADIQREDEIADQGLDVSLVLEKMSTAGKGVNILIVDACRDDPFGRSFRSSSRGLANMDAPRGTIIAYATSPGKVASDGDPRERNSPYTKHLVKAMQSPNKPIEQVFKEVRRAVQDETKNQQTPWENTSLSGDFFFRVQR